MGKMSRSPGSRSPPRGGRSRSFSRSRSRSPPRHNSKKQGTAVRWNNDRGFGFIQPQDGGDDIFCHFRSIQDGNGLREGSTVFYEEEYNDQKGKYNAANVTGGAQLDRDGGGKGGGGGGKG